MPWLTKQRERFGMLKPEHTFGSIIRVSGLAKDIEGAWDPDGTDDSRPLWFCEVCDAPTENRPCPVYKIPICDCCRLRGTLCMCGENCELLEQRVKIANEPRQLARDLVVAQVHPMRSRQLIPTNVVTGCVAEALVAKARPEAAFDSIHDP